MYYDGPYPSSNYLSKGALVGIIVGIVTGTIIIFAIMFVIIKNIYQNRLGRYDHFLYNIENENVQNVQNVHRNYFVVIYHFLKNNIRNLIKND